MRPRPATALGTLLQPQQDCGLGLGRCLVLAQKLTLELDHLLLESAQLLALRGGSARPAELPFSTLQLVDKRLPAAAPGTELLLAHAVGIE